MIYSLAALMGAPMPQNIDPQEHLRYFSWIDFAFTSLICTIFVFRSELSKNGPLIFSKRKNARSIREILTSYCIFLVILFCLMRAFNLFVPSLPYWMTNTFNAGRGNRLSIADLAFIALAGVLAFIERLWLFVDLTTQNE